MPNARKQVNVRADDASLELMTELQRVISADLGLPITQSDLFRLGLHELKKKYLDAPSQPAQSPKKRGTKR